MSSAGPARVFLGDALIKGHFRPRLPVFPAQMTLLHEKMTLLLAETPVSVSDWLESVVSLPGFGGLLHSYSGGFAGTQAGGCPEKEVGK